MPKLTLEVDLDLYRLLLQAVRENHSELEDECIRRLEGGLRRSRFLHSLLSELQQEQQAQPLVQKKAD